MSASRRAALWCAVLAGFGLAFWLASPVLSPFLIALGIAYILDPLVERIEGWGLGRTAATTLVTVVFGVVAIGLTAVLVPLLIHELPGLIAFLIDAARVGIEQMRPVVESVASRAGTDVSGLLWQLPGGTQIAQNAVAWLGGMAAGLLTGGIALINLLSLLFLTPVVVFYLLRDWPRILATLAGLLPRDQAPTIMALCREIDDRIAGFLRGQALVCMLLGLFYAVGLAIVGLRWGILVGLLSGLVTIVPYVGVLAGAATGIVIAFFQFESWWSFGAVVAVFVLGQFLEGNFISPRLIGERVGLHPVWIMVALVVGGAVGGLLGVMLAVPVAAAIAVLMRRAVAIYVDSPLYLGRSAG